MNKASGGDGIPAELLKILKDDAVKVEKLSSAKPVPGAKKVGDHCIRIQGLKMKECQCQRMFKLMHNCTHFTC